MADFTDFQKHRYANLTTFKKSGAGVDTPVWFVLDGGKLYMYTAEQTGKFKRLRHNPQAKLAPSTATGKPLGPAVDATARFLTGDEASRVHQMLLQRYGLIKKLIDGFNRIRIKDLKPVFIEFSQLVK